MRETPFDKLLHKGVIRPTLNLYDNLLQLPNCPIGPLKWQKNIVLKVDPILLCKIVWFPWQPNMRL